MEAPNEPMQEKQRDYTIPLFLTGLATAMICVVLCVVSYLSRDFIRNDFAPRLGLIDPTPLPQACPSFDLTWGTQLEDNFTNNRLVWPLGNESDENNDYNVHMKDGQLLIDLSTSQGLFFHPIPSSNRSLKDFYFSVEAQQIKGLAQDGFGLFLRADGSTVHYFFITRDGRIVLQQFSADKQWSAPLFSQNSIPINIADMNKLAIIHSEGRTAFCVNDLIAFTENMNGYIFGSFGVAVSLPEEEKDASFAFDQFRVFGP
jgi:hypothetical protein